MCVLCNHFLFFFFFFVLSESEIKCLLLSDRGSQLPKDAESLSPVLAVGKIVDLGWSCINSSLKVLNHISSPRNDCANCGRSNFCIQARQSVHQAAPGYGSTGSSCDPVKSNIWLGSCVGRREPAGCWSPPPRPGLPFSFWHTVVWGEGALQMRPLSSFSWRAALPLLVMIVSASLTSRAGTLGGWLGVSPASFTQGVGTELRREVIGSETVTLSLLSEQSPFFITQWWVMKIFFVFRVHGGLLKLGTFSEIYSNPFSLEMRKPRTQWSWDMSESPANLQQ